MHKLITQICAHSKKHTKTQVAFHVARKEDDNSSTANRSHTGLWRLRWDHNRIATGVKSIVYNKLQRNTCKQSQHKNLWRYQHS